MRKGGRGECGEEKGGVVHRWKAHTYTLNSHKEQWY